jgi:hypothetical protein
MAHYPAIKEQPMQPGQMRLIRKIAAVAVISAACPAALGAVAMMGCSTVKGMSATCALNGIFVSPFLLLGAGVVAALLVSGWAGLVLVWAGVAIGMTAILGLTYLVGNLVPIDPFAAFIAWVWFIAPTALGYGIGRGVSRLVARR